MTFVLLPKMLPELFKPLINSKIYFGIIYLISLIFVRAGLQLTLYRQGFLSVSADEFARGVRAAKWAENPHIDILSDIQSTWLPFEKYFNGLALLIWPDVLWTPRITVFVASSCLLIIIYLLTYYLFKKIMVAALSTLFISFQPWFVWLSGTPMLEMYYFVCLFCGMLLLLVWLRETKKKGYWLWAGLCFALASGFHVPSWTIINLINLLTLPYFYRFIRQKRYSDLQRLIAYYLISNGVIIGFTLLEFIYTGEVFKFFSNHTTFTKWHYQGYDVSIVEKFLYYPKLIVQQSSGIVWICLLISFGFLIKEQERWWKLFPLLVALLSLLLNSVVNIFSVPAAAAPARYCLFYILMLSFYIAHGTYNIFMLGWQLPRRFILIKAPAIAIAVVLFAYGIWWGVYRIPHYPPGTSLDAVEAGHTLRSLLDENPGTYLIELKYWEYLAVNLTSYRYNDMIFDREFNIFEPHMPSIFLQEPLDICNDLLFLQDLRYVLLFSEVLKLQASKINILELNKQIGTWTIYGIDLNEQNPCSEAEE